MKKLLYVMSIFLLFILIACSSEPTEPNLETNPIDPTPIVPIETEEDQLINLTLEQLSEFDGREGRKAYIAVSGDIYDVSNSSHWPNGNHNGNQAGQDLTDVILNQSPHGLDNLSRVPMIGQIVEDGE